MSWPHNLRLEVHIPDPAQIRSRLGVSSLGVFRLHELDPATMRLGTGRLGTGRLHLVPPPVIWWDLTPYVTSIDAETGSGDDIAATPQPGRLDVQLSGLPRLVELGIRTGTRIQLLHDYQDASYDPPTAQTMCLWSGRIEDVNETHLGHHKIPGQTAITTITAWDVIRELASITRWGTQTTADTAWQRFETIAQETGGIGTSTASTPAAFLMPARNSLHSTNLVDWLTMCATSALGSMWRVTYITNADPQLRLEAPAVWAGQPPFETFTDQPHPIYPSYWSVDVTAGGKQMWSQVDATLHSILAGNTAQEVHTVTDPTAVAAIGTRAVSVDLINEPQDVPAVAGALLARRGDYNTPTVTSITVDGPDVAPHRGGRRWYQILPLAPVAVWERGRRHDLIVLSVRHSITAYRWRTTLTFAPSPVPLSQEQE